MLVRPRILVARRGFLVSHYIQHGTRKLSSGSNTSSSVPPNSPGSGSRISTVFTALLALGVAATSYGVYEFYTTFTIWPKELRPDLRSAVSLHHRGDLKLSERYFRRALDTANLLPLDQLSPEPYLKLSGIAIALCEVLETAKKPAEAYQVYESCWKDLIRVKGTLSNKERVRAVTISVKLGELAEQLGNEEAEEKWKVLAVEEMLDISGAAATAAGHVSEGEEAGEALVISQLRLPRWVRSTDLGAPIETLGEFYARKGIIEYAVPLYLQALSILLPPSRQASPEDRCRGAQLMNNLSQLFISQSSNPSPEVLAQAKAWATKGYEVTHTARTALGTKWTGNKKDDICENVWAVVLFNLGMLSEMEKDRHKAVNYFNESLAQSRAIGMKDGIRESQRALKRLAHNQAS